jgi:hypothetical protein
VHRPLKDQLNSKRPDCADGGHQCEECQGGVH